ncbi:hypothetical protein PIB30_042937 [Stylosanthes scabra]|uniref:Pentatricopeptide repeat-containing protein-mitochondrial domain-containing protein n=1 Tax=Stylosanthes scabra TaxID=79078 RepID=A0ABU6XH39_9FABA|nr:hypothetical protein [Stylosanthes scabra]
MEALASNPRRSTASNKQLKIPKPHRPTQFPSYRDAAHLSPNAIKLCELLTRTPPNDIETALTNCGIHPSHDEVHEVLSLSYSVPSSAVKFFRWAGHLQMHSAHAWNLMIDLLGKNGLFEHMWDAIRSMKQQNQLSLPTFVSVFESYCTAGRFNEAFMSFDVMDRYAVHRDVVAVNSLLSAICREDNQTTVALEFFDKIKAKIAPDGDTFAILLEGWEKEGNAAKAKSTFGEMVVRVGWDRKNMAAYDAFLMTLVRALQVDEAVKFLKVMKDHDCFPGLKFFTNALDIIIKQNDAPNAVILWDVMLESGLVLPNLVMYNAVIGLLCNNNQIDHAFRLLDQMVFQGVFPDSLTYNIVFECLVRNKKVHKTDMFFNEMVKNEFPPTSANCTSAIAMFFDSDDPEAAQSTWTYMVENRVKPLSDAANEVLLGLCKLGRLSEVKRSAEDMLDRRIIIYESTMAKLKDAFYRDGRSARDRYDSLSRRWKALGKL